MRITTTQKFVFIHSGVSRASSPAGLVVNTAPTSTSRVTENTRMICLAVFPR